MRLRCLISLLFLLTGSEAGAQQGSVWDKGNSASRKMHQKTTSLSSRLKSYNDHLQRWGLDTGYNRSLSVAGRLNSDGWSGGIVYGRKTQGRTLSLWQLTFSEVKHEKEIKQQGSNTSFPQLGSGTPYIYGKINNVYLLNIGYSREKVLLPAVLDGNISIGIMYGGGLSLAMLKPYYLELIYPDYSVTPATAKLREEAYSEGNAAQFLNQNLILGRGRWSKGLDAMTHVPGLYAEAALTIQPRNGKAFIQTVSLGISGAVYSNELTIMAQTKAMVLRGCLFAALEIGKWWK